MRKMSIEDINKNIEKNKNEINYKIAVSKGDQSLEKTKRVKNEDEKIALTKVAKASISNAKKTKKFVYLGDRKLYYDPS